MAGSIVVDKVAYCAVRLLSVVGRQQTGQPASTRVEDTMGVKASNTLTARWAAALPDEQTVISGAGLYPLLELLAGYATGDAAAELRAVAGTALEVPTGPGIRLAVAAWTHRDLPLTDRWLTAMPDITALTGDQPADQAALDRWASEHTGGLIDRMPVTVDPETLLLLAGALAVTTTWRTPFTEVPHRPTHGPWQGRTLAGLLRRGTDFGALRVQATDVGPITTYAVSGDADLDVILVLGPAGEPAGRVLPAAMGAVRSTGIDLPGTDGPGVTVREVASTDDRPELAVTAVGFTVRADHDLLRSPQLFGLTAASQPGDHFPGISSVPLQISQGRQTAVATFSATGFEAAAVSALAMRVGSAMRPMRRKQVTELVVDRPFGFLAVHRPTGLVLVAGWVADPKPSARWAIGPQSAE